MVQIILFTGRLLTMVSVCRRFKEAVKKAQVKFEFMMDCKKFHNAVGLEVDKVDALIMDMASKNRIFRIVKIEIAGICIRHAHFLGSLLCSYLRELVIRNSFCNIETVTKYLPWCRMLETLDLSGTKVATSECRALAECMPRSVKTLVFRGMDLSEGHMRVLAPVLLNCAGLQHLDLSWNNRLNGHDLGRALSELVHLVVVVLGGMSCPFDEPAFLAILVGLEKSTGLRTLTVLCLNWERLEDDADWNAVTALHQTMVRIVPRLFSFANMQKLHLCGASFDRHIFDLFDGLAGLENLRELTLTSCWLDDDDFTALCAMCRRAKALVTVDVQDNEDITAVGVRGLLGVEEERPTLQRVILHNIDASYAELAAIDDRISRIALSFDDDEVVVETPVAHEATGLSDTESEESDGSDDSNATLPYDAAE